MGKIVSIEAPLSKIRSELKKFFLRGFRSLAGPFCPQKRNFFLTKDIGPCTSAGH